MTGFDTSVVSNVDSFVANLPEILGSMFFNPRCVVAVAEFEDGRYVQFWASPTNLVIFEVVSNEHLCGEWAMSDHDEQQLRAAGWREPGSTSSPNWRFDAHDPGELARGVAMTRRAVLEVLGERPVNAVSFRSWFARCDVTSSGDVQRRRRGLRRSNSGEELAGSN